MKLLTWNACRLLTGGRELALVNILTSSGADVATITECKIPEGTGEFSVAGYTTFSPTPSLQGGKTRVLLLVKNDPAFRANVKVIADIMDPAVQSVWLHFSHHRICSGGATLGAFFLSHFFFGITSRSTLQVTFDMRDSTSYVDPGLKMRDTFALATVFASEVGPAAPLSLFLFAKNY
jgi:hypothetical protein